MELISPTGVRVRTSDERGKMLLRQGYKAVGAARKAAPAPAPAPRRRPRKKTENNDQ